MGVLLLSFVCSMAGIEEMRNGEEAAGLGSREHNGIVRSVLDRDLMEL